MQAAGGEPMILPVARDEADELALLLRKGMEADLLLITGGVSMGKYDLVEQVLASFEAKFFFTGALIQPGKPVVFGEMKRRRGHNSVLRLAGKSGVDHGDVPAVRAAGAGCACGRRAASRCRSRRRAEGGVHQQDRADTISARRSLAGPTDRPEVELIRWQGSGDLMAASRANCYIVVPPDREQFRSG